MSSRNALHTLLIDAVTTSGRRQYEIAADADITPKHINQMLRGHVGLNPDILDRVLAACGRCLVLGTAPLTDATGEAPDA